MKENIVLKIFSFFFIFYYEKTSPLDVLLYACGRVKARNILAFIQFFRSETIFSIPEKLTNKKSPFLKKGDFFSMIYLFLFSACLSISFLIRVTGINSWLMVSSWFRVSIRSEIYFDISTSEYQALSFKPGIR